MQDLWNEDQTSEIDISGSGTINGLHFDAHGAGRGNGQTGKLQFHVKFSALPARVDPFANLLSILILPTAAFTREVGDARSLLSLADGAFEFSQWVRGRGTSVQSHGRFARVGARKFHWSSQANGVVQLERVESIEPVEAVMIPQGFGKMIEVVPLTMVVDGARTVIQLIRHFSFSPRTEIPQLQFRHIVINKEIVGLRVDVDITSSIRCFGTPLEDTFELPDPPTAAGA